MIKLKQVQKHVSSGYEFSFYIKTNYNKDSRWYNFSEDGGGQKERAGVSDDNATELTIELEEVNE